MRIVFMSGGAREKALRYLLEKNEQIVAVITPYLTDNNRRFENVIKTAREFGIMTINVTKDNVAETLEQINYDILVSCGFSYILNKKAIATAKYAINVHPTLLPKYRGYRSGPYIIINGEKKSGITIHFITEEMDKGNVLAQIEFPISSFDTTKSLAKKTQLLESELLYSVIQQLRSGTYQSRPQDEAQASEYNYMRMPKDSEIDPKKPLLELYDQIRACDPEDYPAFFYHEGEKVCIKLWRPNKPPGEEEMI